MARFLFHLVSLAMIGAISGLLYFAVFPGNERYGLLDLLRRRPLTAAIVGMSIP